MPRIVTWNVHRCVGRDGVCSPARVARVLASLQPDIVALQELDVRRARTGRIQVGIDIAHLKRTGEMIDRAAQAYFVDI